MDNKIIDYMRKINNDYTVKSDNEHTLRQTIDYLNFGFDKTHDYRVALVNGNKQELQVIDKENYPHSKVFKARPHEKITIGDLVYIDNTYYLVNESNANNDKMQSAGAIECNWVIRWICPVSKKIKECPAYVQNSTKYNMGKYEAKYIDYGTSQVYVEVPANEHTIYIDTDMRFFLDKNLVNPSVYEVTQVDHYTYNYQGKGLCHISMSEDKYNPEKDNKELLLPDYWVDKKNNISVFDVKKEDNANNDNFAILFNGKAEIKVGFSKRFEVVTDKEIEFKIVTVDNLYQNLIKCSIDEKNIKISVSPAFDNDILPYPFILQISDENKQIIKELQITIVPML
ncbi:MAG: hypothetical protein ACTTKD_07605 [Peptoanaerobacter stomatis]|uniref:hypothetical protein n=1 Tax=Peptoanaerobacter stomatis TaxID=796937 RepID=UPI003FA0B157